MNTAHYYKNINILFEDSHVLVCVKPAGVPVQTKNIRTPDMESLLKSYLKNPYLGVIHRLDQPVEGILVFAKTQEAAAKLNRQLTSDRFGKHYLAVVCGVPVPAEGTLSNYLVKDGRTNTSRVCTSDTTGAKLAQLSYQTLKVIQETPPPYSLVRIQLKTGRHHQIRVQFAFAGSPLLGDTKYSTASPAALPGTSVALCAYRLCFSHPQTGKAMEFKILPEGPGFQLFQEEFFNLKA